MGKMRKKYGKETTVRCEGGNRLSSTANKISF